MLLTALKWIAFAAVLLALATLVAARFGAFAGSAPQNLGVKDGRLKPPSRTPNSVSSQADLYPDHPQRDYARIEPFPLQGDAAASIARLRAIVEGMRGTAVVKAEAGYLYAQCTTWLMRYVDDLEFWADPAAGVVHVRSASRVGRRDYGVNRERVEAIRAKYLQR